MSTSTPDEIFDDAARLEGEELVRLKNALKDKRLVVLVGAGVTLSATADESGRPLPRLSWTGLIRNGLDYLVDKRYVDATNGRTRRAKEALEDTDTDSLLDAATTLVSQLTRHRQLATWLASVFDGLYQEMRHPDILDVLKDLHERGATLLTTNYDDLLEKHCNLSPISRSNQTDILKFKSGKLDGVFHLHGSFHNPDEVVLDRTSYDQIRNSEEVQNILKTFLEFDYTILFVGCGSGLEDPNFEGLLKWARERHEKLPDRHCLLVRNGDTLNYSPLRRLVYGADYWDLVPYLRRLLDDHSQVTALSGYASARVPSHYFTQEEKECLQSLSFVDLEIRQHTIATALPDTSTWIFERPEFIDWDKRRNINIHKGLLWIKGKPGSGKSVVIKNALKRTQLSRPSSAIISFFFNARGSPLEKTPLGLFRSLLYQLLQQRHLLSRFLPTYRRKRDTLPSGWKWQEEELREYLSDIVTSAKVSSLVIFIDALDECENECENQLEVRRVVEFFKQLTSSAFLSKCELNVCMSSRHYPHISVAGCLEIAVEKCNTSDILKYVHSKLCFQDTPSVDFQKEIVDKAGGVFLWVVLVVASLLKEHDGGGTIKRMRRILQSVPKELDDLFTVYFEAVNIEDRQRTLNLMQWILFAERPLTLLEINCALAFSVQYPPTSQRSWQESDHYLDDDIQIEKVLRALSKGLIEITRANTDERNYSTNTMEFGRRGIKRGHRVQFIHESVRDFLLYHDGLRLIDPSLGQSAVGKSHDQLTKTCINYLSMKDLQTYQSPNIYYGTYDDRHEYVAHIVNSYQKYVFWDYAVRSLFKHAIKAECEGTKQKYLARFFYCDRQSVFYCWRYFNDCLSIKGNDAAQGLDTAFLHIASEAGLTTCVFDLLGWGVDINIKGGRFCHALAAATSKGHEATVRLLLEKGANVNAQNKDGKTALHWAALYGHEAIVRLLLEKGANVNAQDKDGKTALHWAAPNKREAIVWLLLKKGANVNAQDKDGETALYWAASSGHEATVRLLLEKGANVNAQEKNRETALRRAASNGHEAIVRLLLEKGANVNTQDKDGETALHLAASHRTASNEHKAIVRLLLEKGANVNTQDKNGKTALRLAASNEHRAIVRLLLEKGANVNTQDRGGKTALHLAALYGHEAIVRLLLEKGANVNTQDKDGKTALHWAALYGHEAIVRLLLEKGANVNTQDKDGETALHLAAPRWTASTGHEAIVRLLLEKGANVNTQDKDGETALHRAASNGHEATVRLLLEKGANVNTQDKDGKTALHRAASNGHEATVRLLLEKGANVNTQDIDGETALHWAASNEHEAIVPLLLEKEANVNTQDIDGETALHLAALYGHKAIVRLLLEKGANVNTQDKDGETALHWAASNGHEAIVRLLLEKGANVNAQDIDGETALHLAAFNGHEAIVPLLLEKGANVNTQDKDGKTALHWAASNGDEAIVRLLLEKGANVNAQDIDGKTALHLAASNGHEAIVPLLLEKGANVNAQDKDGKTALHWAASNGHEAIMRLLLEKGANVKAQNKDGKTGKRANINAQDEDGEIA